MLSGVSWRPRGSGLQHSGWIGAAYTTPGGTLRRATRTTYTVDGNVQKVEEGYVGGSDTDLTNFQVLNWTVNEFDGYSRLVKTSKQHMESSNVVTTMVTQTSYDAFDRVLCTAVRMNQATFGSLPSDACTLGTAGADGVDRITKNTYDKAGQLLKVTKAFGTSLAQDYATYTYSQNGKQTSVADANGNLTGYAFDGFDRLIQTTFPSPTAAGQVNSSDYEAYSYDAAGNRISVRKRDGNTIQYGYDAINRMSSKSILNNTAESVTYVYDYLGHMTSATDGNGVAVSSSFDALGRKMSETVYGMLINYQYDLAGNRTRITWPDQYFVQYAYDSSGRMASASANGTSALATYGYENFGRLAWVQYGGGSTNSMAYSWSADDDLTSLTDDLAGTSYDVSFTNSFTEAKQVALTDINNISFVYAPTNPGTTGYAVNGLNQYTTVTPPGASAAAIGYDANGNLTSDGTFTFAYDVENRLTSSQKTGVSTAYAYDPLGRRYQKVVTGGAYAGTAVYLNSGDDEIAEYTGGTGSTLSKRYIPGAAIDKPIAMIDVVAGTTTFFYIDRQGSVMAMSDSSGNKTEGPFSYGDYGDCVTGDQPCAIGVPYKYTGRRYDPESGLYYYRARYYSASLGRFLQTDPVGYTDNLNWYAYVGNDPTDRTDPTGNATTCSESGCTMTADSFNEGQSNHKTIIASPDVKAAVERGKGQVTSSRGDEKLGFVTPDANGTPTLQPGEGVHTGSTNTGSTATAKVPAGAMAVAHGHIESGPNRSNGMVDDPKSNGGYGDMQSLRPGVELPNATVYNGQVGWHELKNGQATFSYPNGAMTSSQASQMQRNLNNEQKLFQNH